jgi:hypothetical protein
VYTYDNSENNPHNPVHPPVRIHWGEETKDEMALVFLTVLLPTQKDIGDLWDDVNRQYVQQFLSQVQTLQDLPYEMLSQGAIDRLTLLFKRFDKNNDGKLDDDERTAMLAFVRNAQASRDQRPEH